MNYKTIDEMVNFDFTETYIQDMQVTSGFFHIILDGVRIKPENSCNRDIREMRANNLLFKIEEAEIQSLVKEGYKVFDANGNLREAFEDVVVSEQEQLVVMKEFADGNLYSLEKQNGNYIFTIDAPDEHTYCLTVSGSHDVEEWDRFLNL